MSDKLPITKFSINDSNKYSLSIDKTYSLMDSIKDNDKVKAAKIIYENFDIQLNIILNFINLNWETWKLKI